jgi:hypothetical protein
MGLRGSKARSADVRSGLGLDSGLWRDLRIVASCSLLLGSIAACGEREAPRRPLRTETPPPAPPPVRPDEVFSPVAERGVARSPSAEETPRVDEVADDDAYASDTPLAARRLVYRAELHVPAGLGQGEASIAPPAAELRVDVADDRLRAQFIGSGWPVARGAEVRLRRDRPGVYVFDESGGRPLGPGRLGEWFQGGPLGEYRPLLGIRPPPPREEPSGPGALVCALLAEWIGEERDAVLHRCEAGPPSHFRLGPYRAERTADLPLELPRSALRVDHRDPPHEWPIAESASLFFEASVIRRLGPATGRRGGGGPLVVRNGGSTRLIVAVDGIAIGTVAPSHALELAGLPPTTHAVGALRPLGAPVLRGRTVTLPSEIAVRR